MRDRTKERGSGDTAQAADAEGIFTGHDVAVPSLEDAPPQLYQAAAEVLKFLGEAEESLDAG